MIDKYFTPELEDIRVGYEYEEYHPRYYKNNDGETENRSEWIKRVFSEPLMYGTTLSGKIKDKSIRVPFLDRERIESEGWELTSEIPHNLHEKYWGLFKKGDYEMRFWLGDEGWLEIYHLCTNGEYDCIFQGRCDDINTLRYIVKLLQIK